MCREGKGDKSGRHGKGNDGRGDGNEKRGPCVYLSIFFRIACIETSGVGPSNLAISVDQHNVSK